MSPGAGAPLQGIRKWWRVRTSNKMRAKKQATKSETQRCESAARDCKGGAGGQCRCEMFMWHIKLARTVSHCCWYSPTGSRAAAQRRDVSRRARVAIFILWTFIMFICFGSCCFYFCICFLYSSAQLPAWLL